MAAKPEVGSILLDDADEAVAFGDLEIIFLSRFSVHGHF